MLIAIHGHPAQAELAVTENTAKLGREGNVTITTLEYGDPGQPGSKTIKVTTQAIDHQGSGHVWLTKQEPVEVEVPAQAPMPFSHRSPGGTSRGREIRQLRAGARR